MNQLFRRKQFTGKEHKSELIRALGTWDIVFFGLAAIIGAGSFSSLGEAIFRGGPGCGRYGATKNPYAGPG